LRDLQEACDSETMRLVADVLAAARAFWKSPLDYTESESLKAALSDLDTHTARIKDYFYSLTH
jgi:hypothetical protein